MITEVVEINYIWLWKTLKLIGQCIHQNERLI